MRKVGFFSVFVLLALVGTGGMVIAQSPSAFGNPYQNLVPTPVTEWQIYRDDDYGFTLEYPIEWKPEMTIDVQDPSPRPEWILRRYSSIGNLGRWDLDVWAAHDMDLSAWLEWMGKITAPFPVTEPNANVAGCPAVAFTEDEVLSVFVSDGKYVYRFWYTAIYNKDGWQAFQHMLNTFQLSGNTATGAQIPESVKQSVQQILGPGDDYTERAPEIGPLSPTPTCSAVYNQGCCGLSSSACGGFPCSRQNGVDRGNCTWYVCYRYGGVPFTGNAGTWWSQVPSHAAWDRGATPPSDRPSIAWWSGSPGHVAYRVHTTGKTWEMGWCLYCERERTSGSSPGGYIWKK